MKKSHKNARFMSLSSLKLKEHEYQGAWANRDLDRCIDLLGKILKLNPKSGNACLQMARVHGLRCEHNDAVKWLDEAVCKVPKEQQAMALVEAGRVAKDFYDPSIAQSLFERAVRAGLDAKGRHVADDLADARLGLAEHLSFMRDKKHARELVLKVLDDLPGDKSARLLWCKLNEDQIEICLKELEQLSVDPHAELRIKANYQFAKMLDKAGDYNGAMNALLRAKEPMMHVREPLVSNRVRVRAQLDMLTREFDGKRHDKWKASADAFGTPKRLLLLGGHPRSGTTLIEQMLDAHPDIVSADETEVFSLAFYSQMMRGLSLKASVVETLESRSLDGLISARETYFELSERCIQEPIGHRLLVDKNPSLTFLAPALLRLFPEIKFLVMLRDPRDIMLSCFMQPFFPPDTITGNFLTLADTASEVNSLLSAWTAMRKLFEGELHELRYEELVTDPAASAKGVLDFLEVEWKEEVMDYDRHAREKVVRSPTAEAVTEKVHSRATQRWKNYEAYLGPSMERLAPCLKALDYD